MVREITWTHNLIILEKCKDDLQREFYIRMTRKCGWTKNVLVHQIENQTYEKTLLNQTTFDRTVSKETSEHAKLAVKDEYTFDFLDLAEEHSERELKRAKYLRKVSSPEMDGPLGHALLSRLEPCEIPFIGGVVWYLPCK